MNSRIPKIMESLNAGRTVYINTMTRSTKITPATAKRWAANGHTLFIYREGSDYMASGNKFVCIDYCSIQIV